MLQLSQELWEDDQGAIISVEWLVVVTVLLFGLIPGFVALRNGTDATMATVANLIMSILPNFTFSGYFIGQQTGPLPGQGGPVAGVGGYAVSVGFDPNDPNDTSVGGNPFPFIWAINDAALPGINDPISLDGVVVVDPAP